MLAVSYMLRDILSCRPSVLTDPSVLRKVSTGCSRAILDTYFTPDGRGRSEETGYQCTYALAKPVDFEGFGLV